MNLNKKDTRQILEFIIFSGVVLWSVFNYKTFFEILKFFIELSMPVIIGIIIAFVINVPMKQIEIKIFKINKRKKKKVFRVISIIISLLLIFGVIALLMFLVIPEFIDAISMLGKSIPEHLTFLKKILVKIEGLYPSVSSYLKNIDYVGLVKSAIGSPKDVVPFIVKFISGIVSKMILLAIGFIIAIYILFDKENLSRQMKKVLSAILPLNSVEKISNVVKLTNNTFTNFLTGQCVDAIVLGILFFVSMSILKMPYALIISVLLAVTALVPYIGAFITLVVGFVLIFVTSPIKALWYVILFFVLQQIDENILIPRIVGKSVGLPALWTLIAALIGGSLLGILGIIISIPISSVLYTLLKTWVNKRIKEKNVNL